MGGLGPGGFGLPPGGPPGGPLGAAPGAGPGPGVEIGSIISANTTLNIAVPDEYVSGAAVRLCGGVECGVGFGRVSCGIVQWGILGYTGVWCGMLGGVA